MGDTLAGLTVAVITVSDSVSDGRSEDRSGPEAVRLLEGAGATVSRSELVPDESARIVETLRSLVADPKVELIVTTGGTGVAPSDVTPEATEEVCDRLIPGLGELMRRTSMDNTPNAALSRAIAGVSGQTLILNLPGSPGGVRDCLKATMPVLGHAVRLIQGEPSLHT